MQHVASHRRVRLPLVGPVRLRVLVALSSGIGLVLVAFVVTLAPLWLAHHHAEGAADDLTRAKNALAAGDLGEAQKSLAAARRQVDDANGNLDGPGASLWSHLPVMGPGVRNGRHLVASLDQATKAATIGVDLLANALSPSSHLVEGSRVNLREIERLSNGIDAVAPHLRAAQRELDEVHGDGFLIGGKIGTLKQQAAAELASNETSYRNVRPLLRSLAAVLGASRPQTYLITIMNPAEQRYSGGATLQMATVRFDQGVITFGRSESVADVDQQQPLLTWSPVRGSPFHSTRPTRLANATFSPWWRVSGEELLRAWQAQTGQRCQGVIAVDLQALAGLFEVSGPMQVPGYGELNANNLVRVLAGSYDSFQDPDQRRRLNNAIVPAFQQKFLGEGSFVDKGRALLDGAKGRHVAIYFRDHAAERAFAKAGFAGNLSQTRHDYLGVFSQNLNGSKSDYWQRRQVSSQVTLHADGSADETTNVITSNPAPAYQGTGPDPRTGYDTRWLGTLVSVFLPQHSRLGTVIVDGRTLNHPSLDQSSTAVAGVRNRPWLAHAWTLAPQQSGHFNLQYAVPRAATVDNNGDLTYRLDLDPQDLVTPQSNTVTLTIPDGYHFGALPAPWSASSPSTAVLRVSQLVASSSWHVPVLKD